MKRINYALLLIGMLMFTLTGCNNNGDSSLEINVMNHSDYTMSQNGEVKIAFEISPQNANISGIGIKCVSYSKRTDSPEVETTLKNLSLSITSIAMDSDNPGGRIATVVLHDANGNRFTPNSSYFYNFIFRDCYFYKGKTISDSFRVVYDYGN